MSEYINVERPFLDKLRQLDWEIIDQGRGFVPGDPSVSKRTSFREVLLKQEFFDSLQGINLTDDGRPWLTTSQCEMVWQELTDQRGRELLQANRYIFELLTRNTTVDVNELTGEKNPLVHLIDFRHPERNSFLAINQFRVDTPGASRQAIIPDIVLFVNGLPLVVIECKDQDMAEPLSEAFIQINRYSNHRRDDYGIREGEERLFHTNLFSIITHGSEARCGTITGEFDHYLNWKDIFPEEYKTIQVSPHAERQEVMIHGMLNKFILLDILRNFTIFMEIKKGELAKVICRYQQYRAVGKILQRLRTGKTPFERGGVIWHTQGSGKSLTMVFLIRKLRDTPDLRDFKIIAVNILLDLEDQLTETMAYTGESVTLIEHKRDLDKLKTESSNLNMVMLHKFLLSASVESDSLRESGIIPQYIVFPELNDSEKVLILIDEAHQNVGGEMGANLLLAFPNAVKIGFTGTPLLTESNKLKTHERFGSFIDVYKMNDSVADRATVDILYLGKTSQDRLSDKELFKQEFEDMFRERTEEERTEIQKRYGTQMAYLESKERIKTIAADIIRHYTQEVMPNGLKGQVVASSIAAACRYKYELENALQSLIAEEERKDEPDAELLKQMKFLKICAVVTQTDNNEPAYISLARRETLNMDAVESFKKDFNHEKPETGVALLCVCDRLLMGFDAPVEQVMYLDKNLREHRLMQAIARVNRTKVMKNGYVKEHGIVVDYYGVAAHLKEALAIFTDTDVAELADFSAYFRGLEKELPVLESRYQRLLQLFIDKGVLRIEDFLNQKMEPGDEEWDLLENCLQLGKDMKFRAQFDTYLRAFFDSMDLLYNSAMARDYYVPAKRLGYILIRMRNRYRDDTLVLKWAGAKVRKLIDKYLISEGINPKIAPVKLLSEDFPKALREHNKTSRAKASEMEHAIRWHIKVNMDKDPAKYTGFNERLQQILDAHKAHWDAILAELTKLREDIAQGGGPGPGNLPAQVAPFLGLMLREAGISDPGEEQLIRISETSMRIFDLIRDSISIPNFWIKDNERRKLEGLIQDELDFCGLEPIKRVSSKLTVELVNLAHARANEITES